MSHEDSSYYEDRAETELILAQNAQDERAVQAHYQLATAYLDRVHGDTPVKPPGLIDG